MNVYTVTFILKGTQSHITSMDVRGESARAVADAIYAQSANGGFVDCCDTENDTFSFISGESVAAFKVAIKQRLVFPEQA